MQKIDLIIFVIIYSNDIYSNDIYSNDISSNAILYDDKRFSDTKKEEYSIKSMWTQHSYNVKKIKQQKK